MNPLDKDICAGCLRKVLGGDEGIRCDGPCDRWFHRECVRITKTEYTKLSSSSQNKWYCTRVDCTAKSPLENLVDAINSLVVKVDSLSAKVDKLEQVPEDTKAIKAELSSIQEKLNVIEPRIDALDRRISAVEERDKAVETKVDDIVGELNERSLRRKNIIVFNAPESNSNDPKTVESHDLDLVASIVKSVDANINHEEIKFFRLGQKKAGKSRLVKLIFRSEDDKLKVINNFSANTASVTYPLLKDIKLSWDRTTLEIKTLDNLRKELEDRTAAGEPNLTIKYKNGVPTITTLKAHPKN